MPDSQYYIMTPQVQAAADLLRKSGWHVTPPGLNIRLRWQVLAAIWLSSGAITLTMNLMNHKRDSILDWSITAISFFCGLFALIFKSGPNATIASGIVRE